MISLHDAVPQWEEWMRLVKGRSEATITGYRGDMKRLTEGITTVEGFTLNHVRGVLAQHQDKAASTRARWVATAKNFAAYAARRGWSDGGQLHRLTSPKKPQRVAGHYTQDEALSLLDGMRSTALPDSVVARDWALLELLYGAGLRIEEACSMDIHDVDVDGMKIRVTGKGDKDRVLPIGPNQLLPLAVWLAVRAPKHAAEQALFLGERGERLTQRVARRAMKYACEQHEVRALPPHALRHSCATHMIEGGADIRHVAEMLGHNSLDTTQGYLHVATKRLVTAFRQSHPREKAAA